MIAHIIYPNYYIDVNKNKHIGGIETYIDELILVLNGENVKYHLHQCSDVSFELVESSGFVSSYALKDLDFKRMKKKLFDMARSKINSDDLIIFAADQISVKSEFKNTIAIQHGVYWDLPISNTLKSKLKKIYSKYQATKRISNVNRFVTVDYNYLNWLRTCNYDLSNKVKVIPNFSNTNDFKIRKKVFCNPKIKILFARRFVEYRGVKLFVDALNSLTPQIKSNIEVTFAGDGPLKNYIEKNLIEINYNFDKYKSSESVNYHRNFDIAVVPSIGSEGTSLSAIEAMAAGCVVVCSNVGGMTNIILDGYNGYLVAPTVKGLQSRLSKIIEDSINDKDVIKKLSENATKSVESSFSIDKWRKEWRELLDEYK